MSFGLVQTQRQEGLGGLPGCRTRELNTPVPFYLKSTKKPVPMPRYYDYLWHVIESVGGVAISIPKKKQASIKENNKTLNWTEWFSLYLVPIYHLNFRLWFPNCYGSLLGRFQNPHMSNICRVHRSEERVPPAFFR